MWTQICCYYTPCHKMVQVNCSRIRKQLQKSRDSKAPILLRRYTKDFWVGYSQTHSIPVFSDPLTLPAENLTAAGTKDPALGLWFKTRSTAIGREIPFRELRDPNTLTTTRRPAIMQKIKQQLPPGNVLQPLHQAIEGVEAGRFFCFRRSYSCTRAGPINYFSDTRSPR